MSFSDNDLKRLKEDINHWRVHCAANEGFLEALLARLEAAEKALGTDCYANGDCVLCKVHHEAYLKWLKSKGEAGK